MDGFLWKRQAQGGGLGQAEPEVWQLKQQRVAEFFFSPSHSSRMELVPEQGFFG